MPSCPVPYGIIHLQLRTISDTLLPPPCSGVVYDRRTNIVVVVVFLFDSWVALFLFVFFFVRFLVLWYFGRIVGDWCGFATWRIRRTGRVQKFLGNFSSSELSSHQISVRALVRQEVQYFTASRSPFEVISVCSLLTRTHSLMGRAQLQLKGCLIVHIIKFTHYAIGGVAAPYLHTQGVRHYSIFRLYGAVATASLLPGGPYFVGYFLTATIRGRLCESAASAGVSLQTPFPPFWSRSGMLRRSPYAPGLAGGFQQAVKSFFVIHFAVDLAFLGLVACLAGSGPSGGRRLALMASSSFCRSSVARCSSKVFPRYVVARGSWVLGPVCLLGSGPLCRLWSRPVCFVSRSSSGSFWEFRAAAMVQRCESRTNCDEWGSPIIPHVKQQSQVVTSCSGPHPRLDARHACLSFQSGSFQEIV